MMRNLKLYIHRIINEEINRGKRKSRLIYEKVTSLNNKTIISVDIQPEYQNWIHFNLNDWVEFLNNSNENNRIVFLYNGFETLGMIKEDDYKDFLYNMGANVQLIENATFTDKGCAFFRYCMDNSIDEDNIADLVRFMDTHNISDSRLINKDMWEKYMEETGHNRNDVRDLLESADDMIYIPDLMSSLKNYSNIVLMGGGMNECLKEVEIALMALNKSYNVLEQFVY